MYTDAGLNIDRYVEIAVAHGVPEDKARASIEGCKAEYNESQDCESSWKMYVCAHKGIGDKEETKA